MLRLATLSFALFALAAPSIAQDAPEGAYATFVPDAEFTTVSDTPPDIGLVIRMFALSYAEPCSWAIGGDPGMREPEVFDLTFRYSFDEADTPDHPLKLYAFYCSAGAYNTQTAYMAWDSDSGLRPITFAIPTYAYDLADPNNPDGPINAIRVTGFETWPTLTNSAFDPELKRLSSTACFRGICDASAVGAWVLDGPTFRLDHYAVDPSYDGEQNLVMLVDYTEPLEVPLVFLEADAENSVTNN